MPAPQKLSWATEILWHGAAFGLVIALGALNLHMPFVGDQAALMLGARVLDQGGTLYADYWTIKMPALFWFYQFAGSWFGWTEQGIHLLELLYLLAFSAVLALTLRGYVRPPWLAALTPVAVVGTYYASAVSTDMTLVEVLVAFPLYLSLWYASCCDWDSPAGWRFALASGVFAGITVTFKLIFAPLLVAAWAVVAVHLIVMRSDISRRDRFGLIVRRGVLPITAGVVFVVASVVVSFWQRGALPELLWTAFQYPRLALQEVPPAPLRRLLESFGFFVTFYFVWAGFILVAVIDWWRGERNRLTSMLLVWLVMAVPILLVQRFSWWQYHFYFLFTPAGVLGVKGLSVVLGWILQDRPARTGQTMLLCVLLSFPPVAALAIPARDKITPLVYAFIRYRGDWLDYQSIFRPDYRRIFESTRFLRSKKSIPGPIYVFGSPMYHHFGKRDSVVPIPGVAWQFLVNRQWAELGKQLRAAHVPYIYVDKPSGKELVGRRTEIWGYIAEHYQILTSDDDGVWFRRIN